MLEYKRKINSGNKVNNLDETKKKVVEIACTSEKK